MRILCDYAHADLWESLVMLFEDRFGWELYRPIGMAWHDEGIWRFDSEAVARQFLAPWADDRDCGDYAERVDTTHPGRVMKMVTLEQARSQSWDLVIATLAENEAGLWAFATDRKAHYGIQIGNQGAPNQWGAAEFALCSTTLPFVPWKPHVFYRQEFSLADFHPQWPTDRDLVMTRVQCFTLTEEYPRFQALAAATPELRWRWYGHCGDHDALYGGDAPSTPQVAAQMRAAAIGYQAKRWSDGYGHVVHNLFACGKPVLGTATYYADKLAGPLFVDGVTSFDIETRSNDELVAILRRLASDDDYYRTISDAAVARFREIVDFDAEAEQIRTMLDGVLSDRLVTA